MLVQHKARATTKGELGARGIANMKYSVALINLGKSWDFGMVHQLDTKLFAVLVEESVRRIGDFNAQGLDNTG